MISCDNKAKIPLGLPCVNRLSSLSHKFFIEGPNFQDHDLRTGYLINPEGYLVLEFNSDCIDEELYLYELNVEGTTQETVDLSETHEHANQYLPYTLDEQLQSQYQQDVPWSNSIDPLVSENNDEIMPEVIIQTDGAASSSSSDEFGEDYDFPQANMKRHIRIVSDEEQCDSDRDHDTDSDSEEDIILNSEDIDSDFIEPGADKIIERNGRKHIKIPATGRAFVFYKSHRAKPSSISRHVDDIVTMYHYDKTLKHNLILLCDDGSDWAGRSVQTKYWLGWLWKKLDLDILIVARNAPGDSKWNPVER